MKIKTENRKCWRVIIELALVDVLSVLLMNQVAKEQAEKRAMAQLMFDLGQKAYGRGKYGRAIKFLEGALTIIARPTLFGGEVS